MANPDCPPATMVTEPTAYKTRDTPQNKPSPPIQPPTHPAMAGIVGYLRERRLQPGDKLPSERDFAERLGVGRKAVREALATLVTLRVVDARPNSGIYLRHMARESSFEALVMLAGLGEVPTPTEIAETMEVRAHLELLAVGLACERRSDDDIHRLEAVLQRTERVLASGNNIAGNDTEFHIAAADATHNSVLVRVLNAFYELTAGRRSVLFESADQGSKSAADHRQLLEHIKARDKAKARALILNHMNRAERYWGEVLETQPETSTDTKVPR